MTRPNYTHIAFLLDRSGSMQSIREAAIGGFNRLVSDQAAEPGECTMTLVQFDGRDPREVVFDTLPIGQVPPLTEKTFVPRDNTPLIDAMGSIIVRTGEQLSALPEADRLGKVIVVILTDGLENASREYTRQQVFDMITHQRMVYGWDFVFLGANQDAIGEAGRYGIDASFARTFDSTEEGTLEVYQTTSDMISAMRASKTAGSKPADNFSPRRR